MGKKKKKKEAAQRVPSPTPTTRLTDNNSSEPPVPNTTDHTKVSIGGTRESPSREHKTSIEAPTLLINGELTSSSHTPSLDNDDRAAQVLDEVKRRKAIVEAAVQSKSIAKPHTRIEFYPFAYAVSEEYLKTNCLYCLADTKLRECSGKCKYAWFCNEKCEKLAEKDHTPECDGYKRLREDAKAIDVEVRLLGRIAHRYKQIQDGTDKTILDFYTERTSRRGVMEIWAHESSFAENEQYRTQFDEIYKKLSDFYSATDLPPREETFKLHCRDFVNRHAISDRRYQNEIGKGLYLDLCEYDHSCAPDTVFYSIGFKSILVGLNEGADISDSRKSFYSYVDLMSTLAQRQKQLLDTWFFQCKCTRCENPNDHMLTSVKCQYCYESGTAVNVQGENTLRNNDGRACCTTCKKPQEPFHVMEANYLMRDIDNFMDRCDELRPDEIRFNLMNLMNRAKTLLPDINTYRTRVVLSYVHWIDLSAEDKARVFVSAEPCLRHCFPPYHPGLAFYLRDVAHFCADTQAYADAIFYISESLDIMERIFVEHEAILPMRQKLADLQRRHALQKECGSIKRLHTNVGFILPECPPLLALAISEPKTSHGSVKERTNHRRAHRAATPLPVDGLLPPVIPDIVRFADATTIEALCAKNLTLSSSQFESNKK